MEKPDSIAQVSRPIPLNVVLMAALAVHLPLLLMQLPLKSYDTNFHIFFASHYVHHWFDPWNSKWYAGFSQTTYPPLPQQWVALFSRLLGMDMAYMAVQLLALMLLVVGVYRFSLLWVDARVCIYRGAGKCLSRVRKFSCLLGWAISHNVCGTDLFECASLSIFLGPARRSAIIFESQRALYGCCSRPPRHVPLRFRLICSACVGIGVTRS